MVHLLEFLDIFFLVFHSVFIIFNLTGWLFRRTMVVHMVAIGLTVFSWLVLGFWYGWGYCFCTDWHWQVRQALGRPIDSHSYIHFLVEEIFKTRVSRAYVDTVTLVVFICLCILALANGWKKFLSKRK